MRCCVADFRVLVYRERYDDSNIMGELFLRPDCTFEQVRQIIAEDLGQDGAVQLIHGHLGDPMGRSGNLLGPEFDRSSIQEVFSDHDAEMLIVQPDPTARGRGYRRAAPPAASAASAAAASQLAPPPAAAPPAVAGASRAAMAAPVAGAIASTGGELAALIARQSGCMCFTISAPFPPPPAAGRRMALLLILFSERAPFLE